MTTIKISEQCGRCPREENFEVSLDEAVARVKGPAQRAQALKIILDGEEIVHYDYLCEECRGIVTAYCDGTKKQDKKSARRFKRVVVGEAPKRRASGAE